MKKPTVLVTGAAGFVGRCLVRRLREKEHKVIAGIHDSGHDSAAAQDDVQTVAIDLLDRASLREAMKGVDVVYHFAALVESSRTREQLFKVNVDGTRNVWECAAECGVKKALYCSTTAVYGLLAKFNTMITEKVPPRAVEPYGYTKLMGEAAALEIAASSGLHTTIIRPAAIFGPGGHTPFGKYLRDAAMSKLLLAGGFQGKKFNYVHVEDVADAAIHLMQKEIPSGEIFNVTVNQPILFDQAFEAYIRVLRSKGRLYAKIRFFALISTLLHRIPAAMNLISRLLGERFVFRIWHPGFDLTYSSAKLLATSFKFKWNDFERVFNSCIDNDEDERILLRR